MIGNTAAITNDNISVNAINGSNNVVAAVGNTISNIDNIHNANGNRECCQYR